MEAIKFLPSDVLSNVINYLQFDERLNIRVLNKEFYEWFHNSYIMDYVDIVKERELYILCAFAKSIKNLRLSISNDCYYDCFNICDTHILNLYDNECELESLTIDICMSNITDKCTFGLKKLKTLITDFKELTDIGMKNLTEGRKLEWVEIQNVQNNKVTDAGIRYIMRNGCPLRYFEFANNNIITDKSMFYLRNCPLDELILYHNNKITNKGLKYLTNGKCSETLKVLNFQNNDKITDEGLKYLSKCPLEELYLDSTINITNCGLKYLSEDLHANRLRILSLSCDTKITNEGLKYLEKCSIEFLYLGKNQNITYEGVRYLRNDLNTIFVSNNSRINVGEHNEEDYIYYVRKCL